MKIHLAFLCLIILLSSCKKNAAEKNIIGTWRYVEDNKYDSAMNVVETNSYYECVDDSKIHWEFTSTGSYTKSDIICSTGEATLTTMSYIIIEDTLILNDGLKIDSLHQQWYLIRTIDKDEMVLSRFRVQNPNTLVITELPNGLLWHHTYKKI
ncbi:MAG: hypothetical protein IPM74_11050 [Crocinitomicaceae bacterium]|nr:hypothetical protein [Crocinitomicaceae bacterium]MBK8926420.1 hypothetical protein [Crocinitomicaceae bacterium]